MKKLLKFILDSAMLIIYFSVVLVFFEERLALIWSFFRSCYRKGRFRLEDVSFILKVEPIGCVMFAVLIILILKVIISFFGMLFGLIGAAGGARQAGTVDNKKWFSAAGSAPGSSSRGKYEDGSAGLENRSVQPVQGSVPGNAQPVRSMKRQRGEDELLTRTYKTGKERYMEQLNDLLRDGVVTREEYNELKKSYDRATWNGR